MIQTQPLEVKDFSFGITDYFIDGDQRAAQTMENFFLTTNKKPRTRWGSIVYQDQLPLGAVRVNKLSQIKETNLLAFQDKRCYRASGGSWAQITGPSAGTFMPAGDSASVIVDAEWQQHVFFTSDAYCSPQKLFIDNSNNFQVRNAGLPDIPAGVSISNPPGAGSTYLYALCFKYTYMVGTVTYVDRGPVYYYPTVVTGGAITALNTATVTLPTVYTPAENWDTTNFVVEIYRTLTTGSVYYKSDEVPFGSASYIDDIPDSDLVDNEPLYTGDNVASNDTPPKAKYVYVMNDFGYWANIKTGTEEEETLVLQSKSGDPDSVPRSFSAYAEQPVRGLSGIFDRPVVLCTKYIYRIDNFYGDDGSGGMILRRIDDKAGCISAQSIVQTHQGLFWAGEQGFYWSDGFRCQSISDHLNLTYKTLVSSATRKKNIVGTFDPANQLVFWTVSKDDGTGEPDHVWVLDLKLPFLPQGEKPGGTFTVMSGGEDTPGNFKPTQIMRLGNYIYRGDTRGYVLKHGIEYATDPRIDTAVAPASWEQTVITHTYESCFLDFGTKFIRKWVPRILVSADNTTNLSLAISSSNDNNRVQGDLKPIRYQNNITWGDDLPLWGNTLSLWNSQGMIEEWRRFPAGGLRCNYKQIKFTNAEVEIVDSDLLGTATVNPITKTATLGGSFNWLTEIVDYYIAFEHDNYTRQFQITARTPTTLTYSDASNLGPTTAGLYRWIIKGKPKGEVLLLNGYVIHWAFLSKSHTPFSASSLGGNPA